MSDLKLAFEALGYQNVSTLLQTGNVLFEANDTIPNIKVALEKHLTQTFHYEAFVLLYEASILNDIILQYPFERNETHHAYIIFIQDESTYQELQKMIEKTDTDDEQIAFNNGIAYWKVAQGASTNTPYAKLLAKAKYKSTTTIRNINTLEKMIS